MHNVIASEWLKQKRGFGAKLVWITPLFTLLLTLCLMGGHYFQQGAFNWWYLSLLPAEMALFSASMVTMDRKKNRHGLLSVFSQKKRLWYSKIALCLLFLFATCFLFFLGIMAGGFLLGGYLSFFQGLIASLLLFLTFAWQIPLWMFVGEKAGIFAAALLGLLCNSGFAAFCAPGNSWWIPFAIPARLMCSILGILPNGLNVTPGTIQADPSPILPGILIALSLFFFLSAATALWFERREV